MKKVLSLTLTLVLIFSLCACRSSELEGSSGAFLSGDQPGTTEETPVHPSETLPQDDTKGSSEEHLCEVVSWDGVTRYPAESETLRGILENLSYSKENICDCVAEYTLDDGYGVSYSVNLSEGFARSDQGQAPLSDNDLAVLKSILDWAQSSSPLFPAGTENLEFSAQYIRTNGYLEGGAFPRVVIIRSKAELTKYYENNRGRFDLERRETVYSDTSIGFLDACDKYDDSYFKDHILVMVLLEEGSGSIRHEVTGVVQDQNGQVNITIDSIVPEVGTCDMAQWHILIELDADVDITDDILINGKVPSNDSGVTAY